MLTTLGLLLTLVIATSSLNQFGLFRPTAEEKSQRSFPSTVEKRNSVTKVEKCMNVTLQPVKHLITRRLNSTQVQCTYRYGYRVMITKQSLLSMVELSPGAALYNWSSVIKLGGNWTYNFKESTRIYTLPNLGDLLRLEQPVIKCDNTELFSDDLVVHFDEGCTARKEFILEKKYKKGNVTTDVYKVGGVGIQVCGYTGEELENGADGVYIDSLGEELAGKFKAIPRVNDTDIDWRSNFFKLYNSSLGFKLNVDVPAGQYARLYRVVGKCGKTTVFTDSYFLETSEEKLLGEVDESRLVEVVENPCDNYFITTNGLYRVSEFGGVEIFWFIDYFYFTCPGNGSCFADIQHGYLNYDRNLDSPEIDQVRFNRLARYARKHPILQKYEWPAEGDKVVYSVVNYVQKDFPHSAANRHFPVQPTLSCGYYRLYSQTVIPIRHSDYSCKPTDSYVQIPPHTYTLEKTKNGGFTVFNFKHTLPYSTVSPKAHIHVDANVGPNEYVFYQWGFYYLVGGVEITAYKSFALAYLSNFTHQLIAKNNTDGDWSVELTSYGFNHRIFSVTFPPVPANHTIRFYRIVGECDDARAVLPEAYMQHGPSATFNPVGFAERSKLIKGKHFRNINLNHEIDIDVKTGDTYITQRYGGIPPLDVRQLLQRGP